MKFTLAPSILLLLGAAASTEAAVVAPTDPQSYFPGDRTETSEEAAAFCASKGQVVATPEQWCAYAKSNTGIEYGLTYFEDSTCGDVEDTCGIPRPTDPPTIAPTDAPTKAPVVVTRAKLVTLCQGQNSDRTPYKKLTVTEASAEEQMGPNVRTWSKYRNAYPGSKVFRSGVETKDTILDEDCKFKSTSTITRTSGRIQRTSAAVGGATGRTTRGTRRPRGGGRNLRERVCSSQQDSLLCVDAPEEKEFLAPKKEGSSSGDPHFKTWTGDKYDYHGECDLVLVDNPTFNNGLGLKLHIRTTSVKYFSYIERVALQIGDDVLEFDNDVDNFLINGKPVGAAHKHHKTMLGDFVVRRDPKAISVRLNKAGKTTHQDDRAKIDFHTRKNGFPGVIVDGGNTDIFAGSLGLLGEYATGLKMARDGATVMSDKDATAFAMEWQVRDHEPMLFRDARFPQFPTTCTPPKKQLGNRLGHATAVEEAEKVCAHWKEDMEDCIFDVIATRDVTVAEEGHMVNIE